MYRECSLFAQEPGEFLQWEEYDLHAQKVVTDSPLVQIKNLEASRKLIADQRPSEYVDTRFFHDPECFYDS